MKKLTVLLSPLEGEARVGGKNILLLLCFMIFFGLVSLHFGAEIGYDIANYHLYNGYALVQGRVFQDIAPAGAWSYFNPVMDAMTYLMITHFSGAWAVFFMGAINGLLGFFTYKLADEIFDQNLNKNSTFYCWSAVLLGLTAPAVFHMMGSAHGDINSSIFIMIGLWLVAKNFNADGGFGIKNSLWIGIFCGIAIGLKLTQLPFGLGVGVAFLGLWILTGKFKPLIGFAIGSSVGFLISDGWWMGLLYLHYKNPIFPFYNQIFHSPFFGTEAISDPTFRVNSLINLLKLPFSLITHHNHVNEGVILDFRLISVFVLGIIFLSYLGIKVFSRNKLEDNFNPVVFKFRSIESIGSIGSIGFLSCFLVSSYVSWAFLFGIYRYAVPMQLVSGILVVYFLKNLLALINKDPLERLGFFIVIVGLMAVLTIPTVKNSEPIPAGKPYVYLIHPPKIPENSMIMVMIPDVLNAKENAISWVLPLLAMSSRSLLSAVYPNFYPENSIFWNKNTLCLATGDFRNLSVNKILAHQGPLFLLMNVDSSFKSIKNHQQSRAVQLVPEGSDACQIFESSVPWVGKLALCKVRVLKSEIGSET